MFKQIITPTDTELVLHIPKEMVGHEVEVNVVETHTAKRKKKPQGRKKRTYSDAIKFFKKNEVDMSKIGKWTREDLYE